MSDLERRLESIEGGVKAGSDEMKAHQLSDSLEFTKAQRERQEMRQEAALAAQEMKNMRYQLLDDKEGILPRIERRVSYTNGKVRKITIALVLIAGIVIGLGFTEARLLIPLFI
jgi:hypothetical protein